ncbi:MAG: DUF5691 domain-containing protein, partial [Actinophytocola sp.]|uniref:DUF5691 domain-containing protein n=1 Tax=Actinophytocola sp. TaxID=1872138 RepID=UPI003D6B4C72
PPAWHGEPVPPAAADPRPECTPTATQVLELLLDRNVRISADTAGGNELLTRQWLEACAAANRRPPAALLVTLLQLATGTAELRPTVAAVTGPRGAWLATRNRRWAWAMPPPAAEEVAERFATATRGERLTLLTAIRRTDPDRGRELVEATWRTETAANRAGLLDALATGLSDADEPFLESTLDDKAATARAAAAALLDRLPGSRRAGRMAERVRALTRPDGTVELPDKPDAAAKRDGVANRREPGFGPRASWLIQLVGAAPLPEQPVLDGAPGELVTGWTKAALRQRNRTWLRALAEANPTPETLSALDPETATGIVAAQIEVDARFAGLLAACPGPWPVDFSILVTQLLQTASSEGVLTLAFASLAEHLDPAALPGVEDWLTRTPTDKRARRRTLRGLAHALTIRQTIQQEFT